MAKAVGTKPLAVDNLDVDLVAGSPLVAVLRGQDIRMVDSCLGGQVADSCLGLDIRSSLGQDSHRSPEEDSLAEAHGHSLAAEAHRSCPEGAGCQLQVAGNLAADSCLVSLDDCLALAAETQVLS